MARSNYNRQQELVHQWAHRLSSSSKASSLYFEGNTIFSYGSHFPIATLYGRSVFFTVDSYSATTSRHISMVRAAVSHMTIIPVKYLPVGIGTEGDTPFQIKNLRYWADLIVQLSDFTTHHRRAVRAARRLLQCWAAVKAFVTALAIPVNVLQQVFTAVGVLSLGEMYTHIDRAEVLPALACKDVKESFYNALSCWEKAETDYVSYTGLSDSLRAIAFLRIDPVKNRLQTSKGIEVPLVLAQKCWQLVVAHLMAGKNDCSIPVLGYTITQISPNQIIAGCHTIPMEQIEKIAKQCGWQLEP